jgi:hypothetical protein
MNGTELYEEHKQLVLARLRTLNPRAKLMSGKNKTITVKEMINHVEKDDPFGKNIVKVQIKMIQVLTGVA